MQPFFESHIMAGRKILRQPQRQQIMDGEINGDAAAAAIGDQPGGLGFEKLSAGMVEPEHDIARLQLRRHIGQGIRRTA